MLSRFGHVWLFVTLCTVACQVPLSMGFSRQGNWSGLPCPTPGGLPDPGIKPTSLTPLALAGGFFAMSTCYRHSVQFSRSVVSDSLRSHESQHARLSGPSLSPGVCSSSCPLNWWCHPTISFSVAPFSSCSQFFPASGSFLMSQLTG